MNFAKLFHIQLKSFRLKYLLIAFFLCPEGVGALKEPWKL